MNYKESLHSSCLMDPGAMYCTDYNHTLWNLQQCLRNERKSFTE